MKRLTRSPYRPADDELALEIADEPHAYLTHFCAESEQHRLLGVAFSERERAVLRAGRSVALPLACDRCIWQRRVAFRLFAAAPGGGGEAP